MIRENYATNPGEEDTKDNDNSHEKRDHVLLVLGKDNFFTYRTGSPERAEDVYSRVSKRDCALKVSYYTLPQDTNTVPLGHQKYRHCVLPTGDPNSTDGVFDYASYPEIRNYLIANGASAHLNEQESGERFTKAHVSERDLA